jgi:ankyrin repeat domain-containing protein 50
VSLTIDNSYLLAALQVQTLEGRGTISTVLDLLSLKNELPTEIDEMYDSILRRIDEQDMDRRDSAKRALLWVTYATDALALDELVAFLQIPSADGKSYAMSRVDGETLIESCYGLLTIEDNTKKIRFMRTCCEIFYVIF